MAEKDELGRRGEQVAAEWFEARGCRVVARNWRTRSGELDLIVCDGPTTVVVEVKTRSSLAFGHPFEAITAQKAARLRRLAAEWCHENGPVDDLRIDAIAVTYAWRAAPTIEHLRGVA